jgi:hypothetical protein
LAYHLTKQLHNFTSVGRKAFKQYFPKGYEGWEEDEAEEQ